MLREREMVKKLSYVPLQVKGVDKSNHVLHCHWEVVAGNVRILMMLLQLRTMVVVVVPVAAVSRRLFAPVSAIPSYSSSLQLHFSFLLLFPRRDYYNSGMLRSSKGDDPRIHKEEVYSPAFPCIRYLSSS